MTSIHPHIQRRGAGHYGRDGQPKISYRTREQAEDTRLCRSGLCHVYDCGDHWHLTRTGWPTFIHRGGWVRGWEDSLIELGVRAAGCLKSENEHQGRHFRVMAQTVARRQRRAA